jgi:hypothetical protein
MGFLLQLSNEMCWDFEVFGSSLELGVFDEFDSALVVAVDRYREWFCHSAK